MKRWDSDPKVVELAARAIADEENKRVLNEISWANFVHEIRRFAPGARYVNHVHDEITIEGVDLEDPHFKRHLDAFLSKAPVDCEELVCVVADVHDR